MTDRELIQMALDALEKLNKDGWILADFEDEVYASIEALRAALANEFNPDWNQVEALQESLREHMAEIQRLRARLAQPEPEELGEVVPADEEQLKRIAKLVEPEPVAWQWLDTGTFRKKLPKNVERSAWRPLYATQFRREWQTLKDDEIASLVSLVDTNKTAAVYGLADFARAIEAKLKEKNT